MAAWSASRAIAPIRSPPASPAPRSIATTSWCIRRSAWRRRLRRIGPKGEGRFAPISWDEALDEIVSRWKAIMAESGPLALLGYAYSAHQGQMNRGLVNGLFHALGTSRLQGGTVCDTCCETAWDLTVGPVGGADPESVTQSDLIVSWGADLMATNVHFWAKVEEARKGGVQVIVIDPRRSRTAQRADWHIPIRIGTDAALALGVMHILVRDGLCDESYLAAHTLGFERVKAEILPRFAPARVAEITGLAVADVERFAAMYGRAKTSFIRLGEGMTRLARGGQALRAVALLPGVTGAYGRAGGGALLLTAASCELNYNAIRKPSGPAATRIVNHLRHRRGAAGDARPADPRPVHRLQQSRRHQPGSGQDAPRSGTRGPLHRRARPLPVGDRALRRHRAAGGDLSRDRGFLPRLRLLLHAVRPPRRGAVRRSPLERGGGAGTGGKARPRRSGVPHVARRDGAGAVPRRHRHRRACRRQEHPRRRADQHRPQGRPAVPHASGKLEFYSETMAKQGLAPMPDWQPDPQEEADAARWPLRLLTAPGYFQSHTAFTAVAFLRQREGAPCCILHPDEARARGLAEGQQVRLFNERGAVGLVLRVSDEVQPGVVLVPGQRPDEEAISGTINMLCSDRYTDMGEGATYQSTFLDVAAWSA